MLVSGLNNYNQLGEESNNKNFSSTPVISPPVQSHLDISSLLSYSTYSSHTVRVMEDGHAYAVGDNNDYRIGGTLPQNFLKYDTEIKFINENDSQVKFISAVCGKFYTLYLVSDDSNGKIQLAYAHKDEKDSPLFLNIGDKVPVAIFGGAKTSAAIDNEGEVIIVTESVFTSPNNRIKAINLPGKDKAIKIACCDKFIIALGASGHAYECTTLNDVNPTFFEISEFTNQKVLDVAGSHRHCFIVLDDGRVFGRGSNEDCRLGLDAGTRDYPNFVEIESLKDHKIVAAFAGYVHSLFKDANGKIIGCGCDFCGPLMQDGEPSVDPVYPPANAKINGPALFCIAGNGTSIVFQNQVPKNEPNHRIQQ